MLSYVDHAGTDAPRELLAAGAAQVYNTDQQLARETAHNGAAQGARKRRDRRVWQLLTTTRHRSHSQRRLNLMMAHPRNRA